MITGCGHKIDYPLPPDPIKFFTSTFTNPLDPDDTYLSIEYNGRTYIVYGTINGIVPGDEVGDCLGYIVQDGVTMEDLRICLLTADPDANYLGRFQTEGMMDQPDFFRAVDTLGQDITTPAYIEDLGYDFWKITDEGGSSQVISAASDNKLTLEYAIENCGVTEDDIEGIDFDAFVDYYGLTEKNVGDGPLLFLINDYREKGFKVKIPDYGNLVADKTVITKEDLDQIEVVFIEKVHEETADETVIDFKTRVVLINDQPGAFLLTEDNITKKTDDNLKQEVIDCLNKLRSLTGW